MVNVAGMEPQHSVIVTAAVFEQPGAVEELAALPVDTNGGTANP